MKGKSIFKDKTIIGKKFEIVCWDTGSFSTPNYSIDVLENDGTLDYKLEVNSNEFIVKSNINNDKQTLILDQWLVLYQ